MSVACPVCDHPRDAVHREAVRRARLIVRIARASGMVDGLRVVVRARLDHLNGRLSCPDCE